MAVEIVHSHTFRGRSAHGQVEVWILQSVIKLGENCSYNATEIDEFQGR